MENEYNIVSRDDITVERIVAENSGLLEWTVKAGTGGLERKITGKNLHRPGLALAGYLNLFNYDRIQIFGNTEMSFLDQLTGEQRMETLRKILSYDVPCLVITNGRDPFPGLADIAEKRNVPVLSTPIETTRAIQLLSDYLDEIFARRAYVHGSLVDVYGIGILITGRSGIGKSEVALDLVARSHRLVSDDVVIIIRQAGGILIGMGNDILRYNMEIRGVGVVDVKSMFGIRGIRDKKRVEVEVELVDWEDSADYERLGIEDSYTTILDEKLPKIKLPIYPGKNISVILEVIALNELLKLHGEYSARDFVDRISERMEDRNGPPKEYKGRDFE